jgi:mono/diheme cytochrome c family protein
MGGSIKGRIIMKTFLILLVIAGIAAPAAALADPKIDYNANCAKCHRETKALPKMAKSLEVDPGKLTLRTSKMDRDEMVAIVGRGRGKMPGFEKELTKEQITDIVDYIIFLKNRKKR